MFALDRQDRIVGVRAGKHMENGARARERPARPFERVDGVGEGRLGGAGGDGRDLGRVLGECARERGRELFRLDAAEGRHAEAAGPVLKERIVARGVRGKGLVLLIHGGHMGFELAHCILGEQRGDSTPGLLSVWNFSDVKDHLCLLN